MIIIRTDANGIIGSGHVMRCISIALQIKKMGEKVLFVTSDHNSESLLNKYDLSYNSIETDWKDIGLECNKVINVIDSYKPRLMLVDSYLINNEFFSRLRPFVKIAYIDDLKASIWNIDYLINYNIYAEKMDYSGYTKFNTKLILGTKYFPLRDEFCDRTINDLKDEVSDVFISAGGADPKGVTEIIIKSVCKKYKNITFHIIVGSLNKRKEEILKLSESAKNIMVYINPERVSDIMNKCDIAISAAGSTLYELCALGVPTISFILADNQKLAASEFENKGIMMFAGNVMIDSDVYTNISNHLDVLISDKELRLRLSDASRNLVDCSGTERIYEAIS